MRKQSRLLAVFVVAAALVSGPARAASTESHPYVPVEARRHVSAQGPLTAPSPADPALIVARFLRTTGIAVADGTLVASSDPFRSRSGATIVRLEQRAAGLRVYGAFAKVAISVRGEIVHLVENVVAPARGVTAAPSIDERGVLKAALRHLYPGRTIEAGPARREGSTVVFGRTRFFHDAPTVERVVYPTRSGSIAAGFVAETWSERENLLHHTLIGAAGDVVFVESRTANDSYNVFIEDPAKGPQTMVSGPGSGNAESPAGWLLAGDHRTIDIAGNNAHAYLDARENNRADRGGSTVADGQFLTAADLTQPPTATGNQAAGVQNLFYYNNRLHDLLYAEGFTEAAGNFQEDNFGLGGADGDSVNAEAHDGGGTDNANFATPGDGRNPRMQMFLWTGAGPTHQVVVNAPAAIAGSYDARDAAFGSSLNTTGVTADVVLVDDGVGVPSDGCEGAQPAVDGKIALIDRGTCFFTEKVKNAQDAGAVGVIVANNVGGTDIIGMGGSDRTIRIPSVMISQNDGATLRSVGGVNATERAHPNPPIQIDSSLDADIVFHEYGHGLTWRMIGGMGGPLSAAVGEGASDVLAFLVNGDDRIAEYSFSNAGGIRRFPYDGYPLTYGSVDGGEVHDDGEIYAAAMWRLTELFAGNGMTNADVLGYFVDGMNFTAPSPAFEHMRDGMLASATGNAAVQCLIWEAFAEYGIGVGASGTVTPSGVVVVEDFTVPATCP